MQTDYIRLLRGFRRNGGTQPLAPMVSGFPSATFPAGVLRLLRWRAEYRGIAPAGPCVAYAIDRENFQRVWERVSACRGSTCLPIESVNFLNARVPNQERRFVRGETAPVSEFSSGGLKPFQTEDAL